MVANLSEAAVLRPLKVVAYLFLILGIFSVIDTVVGLCTGRLVFNLGVLYILIGRGLLRLNPRWLAWAMFFTWLELILMPVIAAVSAFTPSRLQHSEVFGLNIGQAPPGFGLLFTTAIFAISCWQLSVLKSHSVRQLFIY